MSTQYHPNNPNLILLVNQGEWNSLKIYEKSSYMIENYLCKIHQKLKIAVMDYTRTSIMRFDLRFPLEAKARTDHHAITRFFDSLRVRIRNDQAKKNKKGQRVHHCNLDYIWVREKDTSEHYHYHVAIILNYDVYFKLGKIQTKETMERDLVSGKVRQENMYSRIRDAWASALGIEAEKALGLIQVPENATYKIDRNADDADEQFRKVFYRLSYFAKANTKVFGDHVRNFGCSRD